MIQDLNTWKISNWVDLAITKRAAGGSSMPLVEFVELSAPKSYRFWWDMAEELHRRDLNLDAPDFWLRAVAEAPEEEKARVLEDMAETLWSVSDFGREGYLSDLSLLALRQAELWETLAHRLTFLGRSEAEVMEAIRYALKTRDRLENDLAIGEYEICDWLSLGFYFADQGRFSEAFDSYGKSLARSDNPNELLKIILRDITMCALDLEIDLETGP